MKRLNKLKGMYALLIAVAACIGITIYGSCSADEDFWGFDEEFKSTENTRAENMDMSEYLTLSTYDFNKWTEEDYRIMEIAEDRMGVYYSESKNRYNIATRNGKSINISESLYNTIQSQYELTNSILNTKTNHKIIRHKRSNEENAPSYNCFPIALSHMGRNAPSYATAVSECNAIWPNWPTEGVPDSLVGSIIRLHAQVYSYTDMNAYSEMTNLENCVLLIPTNEIMYGHAVNASYYNPKAGWLHMKRIYYIDYSQDPNGKSGKIHPRTIRAIFPFI